MNPESIRRVYLPGIATHFDKERKPCADVFRVVKMVIVGFEKIFEKENPKAGRVRIPFGLDMALVSKKVMKKGFLHVKSWASSSC